jgi:phenylpropionate dioxygenase-like ring-hydroxylating dioxygenase large terminal subunit
VNSEINSEVNMPSIADELSKLQRLYADGVLTEAEFGQAKAQVLAGQAQAGAHAGAHAGAALTDQQWQEQRYHNELARIDREWELEQKEYMVYSRVGPQIPKRDDLSIFQWIPSVFGAVFIVIGLLGLFSAASGEWRTSPWPVYFIPIFMGGFVVWFVWTISNDYKNKADAYQAAYRHYHQRRSEVRHPQSLSFKQE